MDLSILICSVPERFPELKKIFKELNKQAQNKKVEILVLMDNRKRSIGEKRQNLIQVANGDYICQIDDDDRVSPDFIDSLLLAIKENPNVDCINYIVNVSLNKGPYKPCYYSIKNTYENLPDRYNRLPNTRCCIRKEIALQCPIKNIEFGEDDEWAKRLLPLLTTEVNIDKVLYYYDYVTKPTNWYSVRN
jgi:glycosyltransferase involved in cell wall biosynthesis